MQQPSEHQDQVETHLGLWDAVSIIIGIVVGTSIFKTPPAIFGGVWGPWEGLGCWCLGGLLALVGSLCYAELATSYPRMGGDYVYLTRAFGRPAGFLFGWAQLAAILTGSIGAMAYAFGDYAVAFFGVLPDAAEQLSAEAMQQLDASRLHWTVAFAVGSVVVLTVLNLFGVVFGKTVQNLLTIVKILGLGAIIVAGYGWGGNASMAPAEPAPYLGFGLSMVLVLYAFGGWNDAAFVAAEVRNRNRNMPLALIMGVVGILLIYLLVNGAYLWGLGFTGVRSAHAPAAEVLEMAWGSWGGKGISLLVMLSALGAINGMIFTGARVYVSLGADHRVFAWLSHWSGRGKAPIAALLAQSAFALILVLLVGTDVGRTQMDVALTKMGFEPLPGESTLGGFETLVAGTAPIFWGFFLMTGLSLFILRFRDHGHKRPFSVPLYPLEPIVFCLMCSYMLYSSVAYAKGLSMLGIVPLMVGLPLYLLSQLASRKAK